MPFSLKMSKNIKSTTRHLKYSYILIFTNLVVDFIYIIYIYIDIYRYRYIDIDIDVDR